MQFADIYDYVGVTLKGTIGQKVWNAFVLHFGVVAICFTMLLQITLLMLWLSGIFAVVLGLLHFTFPRRFGFFTVLAQVKEPLAPFRLSSFTHKVTPQDLRGLMYVMNNAASYAIVLCGVADLASARWLGSETGVWLCLAMAGFWLLRAASQFYIGRTPKNILAAAWFAGLGVLHLVAMFVA